MNDTLPQGTAQILAGMSPDQLSQFLGGIRQDVAVLHVAPVNDAVSAVSESIGALDLGESKDKVNALLTIPQDGIAAALEARHARVLASDLPDAVKESVSGAIVGAAQKLNVPMVAFKAPAPAVTETPEAPVVETPVQATEQSEQLAKLEANVAARDAIDAAQQPEAVKLAVREAVLADIQAGKVLGADAAKRAVEAQLSFAQRVTESLPPKRTFGDIASRDERATESVQKTDDHPTRARLYATAPAN